MRPTIVPSIEKKPELTIRPRFFPRYFPVARGEASDRRNFIKWSEAAEDFQLSGRIKWPVLKLSGRVFEKLARSYIGDVSRLCDIARISVYFDTIEDITMTIGMIMTDSEVQLMRVKNTLRPGDETIMP